MTNRRQFLQIGIAATFATQTLRAAEAALALDGAAPAVPLYKVLYDVRFPESVAFARRAAARGAVTHAIEGDMTRFWYDDLYHRWRSGAAAIAGLTAHGPLFCLERLAWDQGMRVVFRAEHVPAASGVEHRLSGPVAMLEGARRAASTGHWGVAMADVVLGCPSGRAEIAAAECSSFGAALNVELYSWVIAPAGRA